MHGSQGPSCTIRRLGYVTVHNEPNLGFFLNSLFWFVFVSKEKIPAFSWSSLKPSHSTKDGCSIFRSTLHTFLGSRNLVSTVAGSFFLNIRLYPSNSALEKLHEISLIGLPFGKYSLKLGSLANVDAAANVQEMDQPASHPQTGYRFK